MAVVFTEEELGLAGLCPEEAVQRRYAGELQEPGLSGASIMQTRHGPLSKGTYPRQKEQRGMREWEREQRKIKTPERNSRIVLYVLIRNCWILSLD